MRPWGRAEGEHVRNEQEVSQTSLSVAPLTGTVGAEVLDADADRLAGDAQFARVVLDALGRHGVLVFRNLHLEPGAQVEFCKNLGEIDYAAADDPIPGVMRVTLDRSKNASAPYLKGTFFWHIDGCTPAGDECPQMATVLSAKAVAETGGETEFASTYAAYDDLTDAEQGALHRPSGRPLPRSIATPGLPRPERRSSSKRGGRARPPSIPSYGRTGTDVAAWCSARPPTTSWAWSSRRAGTFLPTCSIGRPLRSASYRHQWTVGDTVIWDNRGVLHRAAAYDADSPREMFRTTVLGDEPIE